MSHPTDFNAPASSLINAGIESAVRVRTRRVALDVGLMLHVFYPGDTTPASLTADWNAMRDFINAYPLRQLPQGNTFTNDPEPVIWHGTYDPATNTASIAGFCGWYEVASSWGNFVVPFGEPGQSMGIITNTRDFSDAVGCDMAMIVGVRVFDAPQNFFIRDYLHSAAFGHLGPPPDIGCSLLLGGDFHSSGPLQEQDITSDILRLKIPDSPSAPFPGPYVYNGVGPRRLLRLAGLS